MTQTAQPIVVHRQAQPLGEAGVNFSLKKVAEYARDGRLDVTVAAMARRVIRDSKCDPKSDLACARAVYGWMQDNGIKWLRDPARAELITAARHFIFSVDESGKSNDDALMVSADCDELTLLLAALTGAMAQSVGVENIAILGHAYNRQRMIGHVLAAVHDGQKWTRIDPSSNREFGWYRADFTREKMIALPSCREICDSDVCASGPRAVQPPPLQNHGDFVGVSGYPFEEEHDVTPAFVNLGDPGEVSDEAAALWGGLMASNADEAQAAVDELDRQHASMMAVFVALGADPMDNKYGWGPVQETAYQSLRTAGLFVVQVHREAANGDRKVQLFPEDNRYAVAALSTDAMALTVEADGLLAMVKSLALEVVNGAITAEKAVGLGAGQVAIIVGGIVVVALLAAGYYAWLKLSSDAAATAKEAKQKAFADLTAECARNNTPEKCGALIKQVGDAASATAREDRKKAEADASRVRWQVTAGVLAVVAAGTAVGVGWWKLSARRRMAA